MSPKYLVVLLSLAVGLGSCRNNEPEPEPTLEGRWTPETSIEYHFDAAGNPTGQTSMPLPKDYYLLFTKDSLYYRSVRDNSLLGSYLIDRQNNSFSLGRTTALITELTARKLALRFKPFGVPAGMPYAEAEDIYSR
ncbi:hypothetical protein [Hymenobacter norwichensis]|uniref:hypothetical protein n=1 Tax=Hymenobacter norwichensis TaxID=223903 RepID=UPI0003B3672F|nr:hypothetical protein [Hymenobacter norwichensis]